MSLQIILVLAAAAVLALMVVWRIIRVRAGRESLLEGWPTRILTVVLLVGPPVLIQAFAASRSATEQMDRVTAVVIYLGAVAVLKVLMFVAAAVVARFGPASSRATLLLALVGTDSEDLVPFDPPMTEALTRNVAMVEASNAAFPRGPAFAQQVALPGFRSAWDALDAATRSLEGSIADAVRLRTGVAREATATATDARVRLETLRRDAAFHGQAWAS